MLFTRVYSDKAMVIKKVLENLERLLKSWGIDTNNWILVANYGYKLLGYDVKLRPGHLNVLVVKNKIPWKIKEGVEIHPPRKSKFREDFRVFMKKTGFDFDLNLANQQEFKEKIGKYVLYSLPNGAKIKVQTVKGAIKEFEKLLSLSTKEGLGTERLNKDIGYLENLIQALLKKGENNTAKDFQKLLQRFESAKKKRQKKLKINPKSLSGIVASKGKVRGYAVVVLESKDASKVTKGKVLITEMTSPSLTEMLPKISAIVTDSGGMLSHAAILARELHVPCLVGTRVATKIFKDGDLIEVDAQNGVVRKLKR